MSIFNQLFKNTSPQQAIVLYYLVAIVIAFLLLNLPFVHKTGVHVNPVDTLFVAVSGVSVTGLSTVNIIDTYSIFGQIIIMIILNIGGIGVMAIGTMLWVLLGRHIGIRERQLIMLDNNKNTMSGAVKLILEIVRALLIIEAIGAILLFFYFYRDTHDLQYAIMQGFFVSVSATTNGGLDITGQSLIPYAKDYFIQTIVMCLILLGSIGFPVLLEIKAYIKNRTTNFRFSLFTKITTFTYFILFILGFIIILLFEYNHVFQNMTWHKSLFHALFQSITTRSAGLQTIDVSQFNESTNVVMGFLMFIGSSPNSVGGGIRTTTFAILILFLINFSNNVDRTSIKVFNREIHAPDIQRSFAVFIMASILTFISTILILVFENGSLTFLQAFFEVMSAFGTTGLSLGVTEDINNYTKVVLMILMFIGRVGLVCFIIIISRDRELDKFHYPKERIQIG